MNSQSAIPEKPDLSVVIPTRNRPQALALTLKALSRVDFPPPERFEVVIVDDGSAEPVGRSELERTAPKRTRVVRHERPLGAAAAREHGWRVATGEWVLFLDDDVRPAPELLVRHREAQQRSGAEVILGSCPFEARDAEPPHVRLTRLWWDSHLKRLATDEPSWFGQLTTGNVSIRRDVLVRCGGFDVTFPAREDYELGQRLLDAGAAFHYEAAARAVQTCCESIHEWLEGFRACGRADVAFAWKHPTKVAVLMRRAGLAPVPRWFGGRALALATRFLTRSRARYDFRWMLSSRLVLADRYWGGIREASADPRIPGLLERAQRSGSSAEWLAWRSASDMPGLGQGPGAGSAARSPSHGHSVHSYR